MTYPVPCGHGECLFEFDDDAKTRVKEVEEMLEVLVAPRGTKSVMGSSLLFNVQNAANQNVAFLSSTFRKGPFYGEFYRCTPLPDGPIEDNLPYVVSMQSTILGGRNVPHLATQRQLAKDLVVFCAMEAGTWHQLYYEKVSK